MGDAVQQQQSMGTAAQPPATRMWGVLGQLSRARDAYARSTDREVRASTAAEISRLVELLRGLANALLEESTES